MRIGSHTLEKTPDGFVTALAPMASVTNPAARALARAYGCGLTVTEMVSAEFLVAGSRYAVEATLRAEREPGATFHVVQLFGGDPATMARAAQLVEAHGADAVDVNMGCPIRKINSRCEAGVALMRDPSRAASVVRAMTDAVRVPVTVKIRAGWDDATVNAPEVARAVVDAGAAMITVHARTRAMVHDGDPRLSIVRAVKESVGVPVLGNGGVQTAEQARHMARETGCDGVMIGRGALGNPWLFEALAKGEAAARTPDRAERVHAMREHLRLYEAHVGPDRAAREFRKHLRWYAQGTGLETWLRARLPALWTVGDVHACLDDLLDAVAEDAPDAGPSAASD